MLIRLFPKMSFLKILSLSFSLIILIFLFFLFANKEFGQKSLAASPVIIVNPKNLDFGEVYKNKINRLRLLVCNFSGVDHQISAFNFLDSTGKFSINPPPGLPQILSPTNDSANKNICDSWDSPRVELILEFQPGNSIGIFNDRLKIQTDDPDGLEKIIPLKGKGLESAPAPQRAKTWLKAQYGDVYAIGDLYAEYTDTATSVDYRLITGSMVQDWESSIGVAYEQINSFISSFPDSNNNFTVSVGRVDTLGLITDDPSDPGENKYDYPLDLTLADYIGSDAIDPRDTPYSYKICNGDLVIGDTIFDNGNADNGAELLAVKGNIYIIGDTYYSSANPAKIEDLASLGFMALKRNSTEIAALHSDCISTVNNCGVNQDCYDAYVNQYGGNIYLVDVHNLITAGADKYIVGVDYNNFNLTDGNIEANKNYCAEDEVSGYPGRKYFDLNQNSVADGTEALLGWDQITFDPLGIYDYCEKIPSPPTFTYNINNNISANTMTVAPIHIVGTYYAEGSFHSGKAKLPLTVQGLVMAQSFYLEREAIVDNPSTYGGSLLPSETFVYDGRAILNPPPGFRELINERFNFSLVKP